MSKNIADILENAPSNRGKWGDDDELGALNYLPEEEVPRGVQAVEAGKTFTLGVPIGRPDGDPGRSAADHYMEVDKGIYVGAPLKIVHGSGSPVNPIAIK